MYALMLSIICKKLLYIIFKYSRRCDQTLLMLWSGCEKYFQKNIARHRLFSGALQAPHSDLGIQNIERCKGFAAQLLVRLCFCIIYRFFVIEFFLKIKKINLDNFYHFLF